MFDEIVPLAVEQDAAEMEDVLGAVAAPAHPRTIEAHPDEVAHRPLDRAAADVEIVARRTSSNETAAARWITGRETAKMSLDLDPRTSGRR